VIRIGFGFARATSSASPADAVMEIVGQPGRLLPVHPKRQAELRAQRKGILFFLKRFGLFPFVRSEHKSNLNKK
jgi:hypothetical protein